MKKTLFTLLLISSVCFSQTPGEIISIEKKLDITPEGAANFIYEKKGEKTPTELLSHLESIPIGLIAYKITYYTKDYDDNIVKATGLVMYPKSNKKMSTVLYCHPTTDRRENVPSNLKDIIQVGFVLPLSYALNNYIVIAPDFYGMGDGDGTQNYGEAKTTAGSILDMMKAGNTFLDQMGVERYNENFITGYSLGGHAGMAALKQATQEGSYKFKHAYLGAGPMDMSVSTLERGVINKKIFPISAFLANIVYTADKLEGNIRDNSGEWNSVIRKPYLDKFIKATVNDKGGILWGPIVWRNLFTDRVVNGITNDPNHPMRKYLKQNDVYDWHNTTPTTLMDGAWDMIIHPSNNKVTLEAQHSYYPWWSLDKYKIRRVQTGPFTHITGILPWLFGSIHRFNATRKGGYFNLRAEYTSNYANKSASKSPTISVKRSSIDPQFMVNGKEKTFLLTPISSGVARKGTTQKTDSKSSKAGIYLAETNINGKNIKFPYVIEKPIELETNQIITKEDKKLYLNLKDLKDEIISISIFRNNKKIHSLDLSKKDKKGNLFTLKTQQLSKGNTIEITTPNNIFISKISDKSLSYNEEYLIKKLDNNLIVSSSINKIKSIEAYNVSGQLLHKKEDINQGSYTFKTNEGVNILKITNSKGETFIKKIIF